MTPSVMVSLILGNRTISAMMRMRVQTYEFFCLNRGLLFTKNTIWVKGVLTGIQAAEFFLNCFESRSGGINIE